MRSLRGGAACGRRPWGLRWSSLRGHETCERCAELVDMRRAEAGIGGGRRQREEGRKEGDAGRCLFKTRTQHHRMVGTKTCVASSAAAVPAATYGLLSLRKHAADNCHGLPGRTVESEAVDVQGLRDAVLHEERLRHLGHEAQLRGGSDFPWPAASWNAIYSAGVERFSRSCPFSCHERDIFRNHRQLSRRLDAPARASAVGCRSVVCKE